MLKRNVSENLKSVLEELILEASDKPLFWNKFYDFAIESYKTVSNERFSISQLGQYLMLKNVNNTAEILVAYYHTMHCLAKFEGNDLFEDGFNI